MLLNCNNKGCCKSGEHRLDTEINEVVCEFCGKVIPISEPMKKALKTAKQVVNTNVKKAFMLGCQNCKANREVIWDESTNTARCKICGNEIKVHAAMKQAMMESAKQKEE